jgi:hypothetical protein
VLGTVLFTSQLLYAQMISIRFQLKTLVSPRFVAPDNSQSKPSASSVVVSEEQKLAVGTNFFLLT